MAQSKFFSIYERLPVFLQHAACSVAGLKIRRERHNKTFWDVLAFLEGSQWWSLEQQKEYQNEQLRELITHAYETVPYYNEVFKERKLTPRDIQTSEDLYKLPILTKEIVRKRAKDLTSRGWPKNRIGQNHTGGTTGTALLFDIDSDTHPWQWAVWWRHRKRFGLEVHDPFIVFAGRHIVPLSDMNPPIWRRNLAMKQTYVSIHHMTDANMPSLVDYLQTRKVPFYSGYPSGLYHLATYMLDKGIKLENPPKIAVTGAESVLPHQRRVIEEAFDCVLADQYGASEHCGNISECEKHSYHVDMEFGVVEFLAMEGMPNSSRRIIMTGFRNPAMPFIRYDIGDVATLSDKVCTCGRESPIISEIDGRIESYIVTPDGRKLGRLDFLFKDTVVIKEAQLVQNEAESVTLKIVRSDSYSQKDEAELLGLIRQYVGDVIQINFEYPDEIPRGKNGKFRQIVSTIFKDHHANAK